VCPGALGRHRALTLPAQPLAVDRRGLTLRIEGNRAHGDLRLAFHAPADDVGQLTERMHVLLGQASAASCPRALQRQRTDGDR
jgi:hypothetical protein